MTAPQRLDLIIIGAGIAGVTALHYARAAGLNALMFEMSDSLPGFHIVDGAWGYENLAIAIPKGRGAGMPFLTRFADEARSSGRLAAMVGRAGLRGVATKGGRAQE